MTCTARAEVDGQSLPVEVLRWVRITTSPSGSVNYWRLDYDIIKTASPECGYQSYILTTTENDTVIYRCRARISTNSTTKNFSDVIVTIEGLQYFEIRAQRLLLLSVIRRSIEYGDLEG